MSSSARKSKALGMSWGTASNRLRKKILFSLLPHAGLENCFHCGELIEEVSQLSIEHKIPWEKSEDPVTLFWDLSNIAFSHLSCNSAKGIPRESHFKVTCPDCLVERTIGRQAYDKIQRADRSGRCSPCATKIYYETQ